MSDEPWRHDVVEALRHGRKIEAIKLYREATGTGLAEAKSFVEALEESLETGELPNSTTPAPDELEHAIVDDLRGGRYIGAIKRHRDATGSGLRESRDAVHHVAHKAGIPVPSPAPIAVWMLIAALVLGGIIGWIFLGQ